MGHSGGFVPVLFALLPRCRACLCTGVPCRTCWMLWATSSGASCCSSCASCTRSHRSGASLGPLGMLRLRSNQCAGVVMLHTHLVDCSGLQVERALRIQPVRPERLRAVPAGVAAGYSARLQPSPPNCQLALLACRITYWRWTPRRPASLHGKLCGT